MLRREYSIDKIYYSLDGEVAVEFTVKDADGIVAARFDTYTKAERWIVEKLENDGD